MNISQKMQILREMKDNSVMYHSCKQNQTKQCLLNYYTDLGYDHYDEESGLFDEYFGTNANAQNHGYAIGISIILDLVHNRNGVSFKDCATAYKNGINRRVKEYGFFKYPVYIDDVRNDFKNRLDH